MRGCTRASLPLRPAGFEAETGRSVGRSVGQSGLLTCRLIGNGNQTSASNVGLLKGLLCTFTNHKDGCLAGLGVATAAAQNYSVALLLELELVGAGDKRRACAGFITHYR